MDYVPMKWQHPRPLHERRFMVSADFKGLYAKGQSIKSLEKQSNDMFLPHQPIKNQLNFCCSKFYGEDLTATIVSKTVTRVTSPVWRTSINSHLTRLGC